MKHLSLFCFPQFAPLANVFFFFEQVLIRLIGADEHLYTTYTDSLKWLDDTDVLEMIVDKFSASVSCIIVPTDIGFYEFWYNLFWLFIARVY